MLFGVERTPTTATGTTTKFQWLLSRKAYTTDQTCDLKKKKKNANQHK